MHFTNDGDRKKLTNVSYVAKLSSSSVKVPRGAPRLARLAANGTRVSYDSVSTRLTLICWPVFFCRMDSVAKALEEVLSSALTQGCITVGVYEAAKSLNV